MTEIKLDRSQEVGWHVLPDELRALSCGDYDGKDMPLGLPTALRYLADAIEEQVKPAIEEPTEFGSIVRARSYGDLAMLWQRFPGNGKHYWESDTGAVDVWSELRDPEVLRVGIGEAANGDAKSVVFSNGWDHGHKQGVEDFKARAIAQLRALRAIAITVERKDAYDQAANAVAELT